MEMKLSKEFVFLLLETLGAKHFDEFFINLLSARLSFEN